MIGEQKLRIVEEQCANGANVRLFLGDDELVMVDVGGLGYEKKYQTRMLKYVEESELEIYPSSVYWGHKKAEEEGTHICRPGYKFMFWLLNGDDAKAFKQGWEENVYGGEFDTNE
jgi:hypothetical protein